MYDLRLGVAETIPVFCHDVNGNPVPGLVDAGFTKRISKASGDFGAMAVTLVEKELGWYNLPLSALHTDALGLLTIVLTHASIKQVNLQFRVLTRLVDDLNNLSSALVQTAVEAAITAAPEIADIPTTAEFELRTLPAATATQLTDNLKGGFTGTAIGTPSTVTIVSDIAFDHDLQFVGKILTFAKDTTTIALRGQATDITSGTASANLLTFTALTTAPVAGDVFTIN